MGLYAKPMKGQELLSFLFEGDRKKVVLFSMYFQTWFSIPTNYNSLVYRQLSQCLHASMSCCPDDLALLLPCLDLWSLHGIQECINPKINFRLYNLAYQKKCQVEDGLDIPFFAGLKSVYWNLERLFVLYRVSSIVCLKKVLRDWNVA